MEIESPVVEQSSLRGRQKNPIAKQACNGAGKKQLLEQKVKLKELFDSALHKSMAQRPYEKA